MKTAKQKIAFVLAMLMVVAMAGCGKGKDKEKETKQIIADDKSVMNMTFTPPAATLEGNEASRVMNRSDSRELQYANACLPIRSTPAGTVSVFRSEQRAKA